MQTNHFRSGPKPQGSSSGASRFSGPRRASSSRPSTSRSFGGGGYKGGGNRSSRPAPSRSRRNNSMGSYIDPARFINKVTVTEEVAVFVPEHQFTDFQIDERLKKAIVEKGYKNPSPIQDKTIPHILKGADLVGIANTGTGKTAAFLIPLIQKVLKDPKENVLVIVPTRELAIQIDAELKTFVRGMSILSVVLEVCRLVVRSLRSNIVTILLSVHLVVSKTSSTAR